MKRASKNGHSMTVAKSNGCTAEFYVDKRSENVKKRTKMLSERKKLGIEMSKVFPKHTTPNIKDSLNIITGLYICSKNTGSKRGIAQ